MLPMLETSDASSTEPQVHAVALVRWPEEVELRNQLSRAGLPRLLLVAPDCSPPVCWEDQEDWVREPAEPTDITARRMMLMVRTYGAAPPPVPVLDADGVVRVGSAWAIIPPVEARLLALLLSRSSQVTARADLLSAGWPNGTSDEHILDSRIGRLRRRVAALGIQIHTVRGHGFLLEVSASS